MRMRIKINIKNYNDSLKETSEYVGKLNYLNYITTIFNMQINNTRFQILVNHNDESDMI